LTYQVGAARGQRSQHLSSVDFHVRFSAS